jgi:hypothetical protein
MAHFILDDQFEAANMKLREGINAKLQFEFRSLSHRLDGLKRESEKILINSTRLCREFIQGLDKK